MSTRSIRNKFIHATLWSGISMYFFFIFNFLCQLLFSRTLSPAAMGIFAFGIAIRELIGTASLIVMPGGYIKSEGRQTDFDAYFLLAMAGCALQMLVTVIIVLYYFLHHHDDKIGFVILFLSISQCFITMAQVYTAILEKKLEYKPIALLQGMSNVIAGIAGLMVAWEWHSVYGLVIRDLLASALFVYLIIKKTKITYRFKQTAREVKAQFLFGIKCTAARMSEVGFYKIPELLISHFLSKTALGYFFQGRYLSYFPIKLFQPFTNSALFSFFSHHQNDIALLEKQLWWINYVVIRTLLPVCIGIYLFGSPVLTFLYGQQWAIAGECFAHFSGFIIGGVLFLVISNMANLLNKQFIIVESYIIGTVLFCLAMLKWHDIVILTEVFSMTILLIAFYANVRLLTQPVLKQLLFLSYPLVVFVIGFLLSAHLHWGVWTNLIGSCCVVAIIYGVERRKIGRLWGVVRS